MSLHERRFSAYLRLLLPLIVAAGVLVSGSANAAGASGRHEITPRIIGGSVAPSGTWPSIVAIYESGQPPYDGWFCGGTLIAKRWVLTAGHCVVNETSVAAPGDLKVLAGRHKLSGTGGEQLSLRRVIPNPNYVDATADNDNALLELATASSQPVRAVIKPDQAAYWEAGDPAFVAGWGGTVAQPAACGGDPPEPPCPTQQYSNDLRQVEVPIVSDSDCEIAYPGVSMFSTLCAGNTPGPPGDDEGKDACQGDSGGALEVETPSGRALIGIVSGGDGCAAPGFAGTYNRTVNYRTWIGKYAATLAASESPLGFGKVEVGKKRFKTMTLTGSSSLPATVGAYTVSGKGFKRAGGTCSTTIESGAVCKIKIRFRPTGKKKRSGYLTVTSAKGVVYRKVKLVGTGR